MKAGHKSLHRQSGRWISAVMMTVIIFMLFLISDVSSITAQAMDFEFVLLTVREKTMEVGDSFYLTAVTSNGKKPSFSSSDSKIASVNTYGKITAKKPGTVRITAKIKNGEMSCKITVKKPSVTLNKTKVTLYRNGWVRLKCTVSGKPKIKWKSSKRSVASVDEEGTVTAVKHGTAVITVTAAGVSRTCKVTVKQPVITFPAETVTVKAGEKKKVKASVSSGNIPVYSSSNTGVATVDENGILTAKKEGRAYIYAAEDGIKERMTVFVTK